MTIIKFQRFLMVVWIFAPAFSSCKSSQPTATLNDSSASLISGTQLKTLSSQVKLQALLRDGRLLSVEQLRKGWTTDREAQLYNDLATKCLETMTSESKASVASYRSAGGLFESVNFLLRNRIDPAKPIPGRLPAGAGVSPSVLKDVKNIEAAFNRCINLPAGLLLFRGLTLEANEIPAQGKKDTDPAFMSTSLNPATAMSFATYDLGRETRSRSVIYVIEIDERGVRALLPNNWNEEEVILPRGMKLDVKKRINNSDVTILHMIASDPAKQ